MMTTPQNFQDLPTTILFDILRYLPVIDRYKALHGINYRIDDIIHYATTHISLAGFDSRVDFDYHLEHILPDAVKSLRFLKISNDYLFDKEQETMAVGEEAIMFGIIKKVQAKINLIAYEKLEELVLENINATQLQLISEKLKNMSQLKRLIISLHSTIKETATLIFKDEVIQSKLKTLTLKFIDANVLFPESSTLKTLSNLEYLTIDSCIIGNVHILLPLVQNIKYLNISVWDFPHQSQRHVTKQLTLPNLTYLKLKVDEIKWSFVQHLLQQCGEKLTHFTFIANGNYDFINAENWKQLITNHFKQLIKFKFHITLWEASKDHVHLSSFNTDFWHRLSVFIASDWIKGASQELGDIVHVYTVPFCCLSFTTAVSAVNIMPPPTNSAYKKIQTLRILLEEKPFRSAKYFYENTNSIILESLSRHNSNILPFLNMSVNINNICHVGFSSIRGILKPQVFSQLLEQCPNLYSLKLHSKTLDEMTLKYSNEKTCLLLQKMIKYLQFNGGLESEDFEEQITKNFARTFLSLERLHVHMKSSEDVMKKLSIMINNMKKLNKIFIKTTRTLPNGFIDQLKQSIGSLTDCYIRKEKSCLFIWS